MPDSSPESWRGYPAGSFKEQGKERAQVSKRTERNNRRVKPGGPSPESKLMLGVLSILVVQGRYRMYEGTVPAKVIAKRRAKNRVARISRRINRG